MATGSRRRLLLLVPAVAIVAVSAGLAFVALQPGDNPSGLQSSDANERCSPSPCGAPDGFEVDVTNVAVAGGHLVLTVAFRNHTTYQPLEAVSYRHSSPADFTLRAGGHTYRPVFDSACPSWPEVDVPRGATSPPRLLCFPVSSASGTTLVWDPDLGVMPRPVSIGLS